MLAIVSPGQGAQSPQMLEEWIQLQPSQTLLEEFSEIVGFNLIELGTSGTAEEIKQTEISQPLIVANSILSAELLGLNQMNLDPASLVVAGHSVGEFVAAYLTKSLDRNTAIKLVAERGKAMALAASANPDTSMSAVLGGEKESVLKAIADLGLVAANVNANGQIVAAGETKILEKLSQNPPTGARVRALDVSAAFHTHFMSDAKKIMSQIFNQNQFSELSLNMLSNKDGDFIKDGSELANKLLNQIDSPVRWDLCQEKFQKLKVTGLLELAPGGVLAGIAKRELPGVEIFAIKSPEDLALAKQFIFSHAEVAK